MNVGWIEIISIIIIFQLLLFSVFLFFKKSIYLSNYILGIYLFSQAAGIFSGFCFLQKDLFYNSYPHLCFIGLPFTFLWGPSFYFYVKSIVNKNFKFKKIDFLHLIPFLTLLVLFSATFYFHSAEIKRIILHDPAYFYFAQHELIDAILRIQVLFYIIRAVLILYSVRKNLKENFSSISKKNLSWLNFIVIGYAVCYIISDYSAYAVIYLKSTERLLTLGFTLQFFIYFNIIFFKAWEEPGLFKDLEESIKYKSSKLTKDEAKNWIDKLNGFIEVEKPYLNPDLTLNQLAEDLCIPARILSQIINEYFNQNFFDYINRLRIEDAKKMLLDPSTSKNIMEILFETGFNSKATFNRVFKKETGLSPTEFRKKFTNTVIPEV